MRQILRELFTGIGGPDASPARLRLAAIMRFVLVVPLIVVPTFVVGLIAEMRGVVPTMRPVAVTWLGLIGLYLVANTAILVSRARRPRPERLLTYLCVVLELATNQLTMHSLGTLTSHTLVFAVVVLAIYRVFFDYRLGLFATVFGCALFAAFGVAEASGLLPIAPGLPFPLRHTAYTEPVVTSATIQAAVAGLLIAFVAVNYGMNQGYKLHRYITESVLRRHLPPALVARAAEGSLRLDAPPDRRVVTVMFIDLVGFTPLAERLGADAIGELLNRFLSRMAEIAHVHGATIDKFVGDAMMVVFGAPEPLPPEEQARGCVGLAVELQEAVRTLQPGMALEIRAGINTGEAVVGYFGSTVRSEYTVVGSVVNIAARLETASRPGRILVGPDTARLVEGVWPLEAAGELMLKGVSAPVPAWFVAEPAAGAVSAGTTP